MNRTLIVVVIVLGLAMGGLLLFSTALFGIGVNADSVNYISTADNLLAGVGFVNYDTSPYVHWTPLYPMTLALFGSLGLRTIDAAHYLNAAVLAGIVIMGGLWLWDNLRSRLVRAVGMIVIVLCAPVFEIGHFALTDLPFALLTLGAVIALDSYTQRRRVRDLLLAAVLTMLACQTRYAGAVLIVVGLVVIYLDRGGLPRKLGLGALFTLIAAVPLALWLYNNYQVSGTFAGLRVSAQQELTDHLALTFDVFWSWLLPFTFPIEIVKVIIVGAVMLVTPFAIVSVVFRHYRRGFPAVWYRAALLASLLYGYTLLMMISSSVMPLDPLNPPFFTAIYLPALFFIAFLVDRSLSARRIAPAVAGAVVAAAVGITSIIGIISVTSASRTDGAGGFTVTSWVKSPLMARVDSLPEGIIFSNAPDAIYVLTGLTALPAPTAEQTMESVLRPLVEAADTSPDAPPIYWVVFTEQDTTDDIYTVDEMKAIYGLEFLFEDIDGFAYRLTASPEVNTDT